MQALQAISLDETNELARMQSRIDNKYLLNFQQFRDVISLVRDDYRVLEIEGSRQFMYLSCYYDDNFYCYYDHHRGRRKRLKVRTRKYVDGGGQKFFEIKLKGPRGMTVKHRVETDSILEPRIDGDQLGVLQEFYSRHYSGVLEIDLRPALLVGYKRSTLVARNGNERVTVDFGLSFSRPEAESTAVQLDGNFIVLETKSTDGKGVADRALRSLHIRQASKCSKYCLGLNLTGCVKKNNNFLATLRRASANVDVSADPVLADTTLVGLAS